MSDLSQVKWPTQVSTSQHLPHTLPLNICVSLREALCLGCPKTGMLSQLSHRCNVWPQVSHLPFLASISPLESGRIGLLDVNRPF